MKALLIGATGLIGNDLLHLLFDDERFTEITVLHRSGTSLQHPKLTWHIVDFDEIANYDNLIKGDVLFNCMGTTIKKAKSEKNMVLVDVTIPAEIAIIAKQNGTQVIVNISAAGAKSTSKIFYNRIKGQLEDKLAALNFDRSCMLRPSLLMGNRKETRLGEKIMEPLMQLICNIPFLQKYRPIKSTDVAKTMIRFSTNTKDSNIILELDEIQDYIS